MSETKCRGCSSKFLRSKPFHAYCESCFKKIAICRTCGGKTLPKRGRYNCCGISETVESVEQLDEDRVYRRRMASKRIADRIDSNLGYERVPVGILDYEIHGPNGLYVSSEDVDGED